MNRERIEAALGKREDDELLDILTGRAEGYSPVALAVAEDILRERGITFTPEQRQAHAFLLKAHEENRALEVEEAQWWQRWETRRAGILVGLLGGGALILPTFGFQFRLLVPLGEALPLFALGLVFVGGLLYWVSLDPEQEDFVGQDAGHATGDGDLGAPRVPERRIRGRG